MKTPGKIIAAILLLSIIFVTMTVSGQEPVTGTSDDSDTMAGPDYETVYVAVKKILGCRVYLPEDYDGSKRYPLVIGLHGYGGNYENFSNVWKLFRKHTFIYAVPEAPYPLREKSWRATSQFSWEVRMVDREVWRLADPWVLEYIADIAGQISSDYSVEGSYLLGFSQGAAYAYAAGINYHEEFKGVLCFGGRLPDPGAYPWLLSEKAVEEGRSLKVFIAHGKKDDAIDYRYSLETERRLKDHGYDCRVFLFDGGHDVSPRALKEGLGWMGIN